MYRVQKASVGRERVGGCEEETGRVAGGKRRVSVSLARSLPGSGINRLSYIIIS